MQRIHSALRADGVLVLTVPQHAWLWSTTDNYAFHERRYSAKDLHKKLSRAGFTVMRSTSFVSLLLPAMMLSRRSTGNVPVEEYDATTEFRISPWVNWMLYRILALELSLIRLGVDFPLGGSRIVVARRNDSSVPGATGSALTN